MSSILLWLSCFVAFSTVLVQADLIKDYLRQPKPKDVDNVRSMAVDEMDTIRAALMLRGYPRGLQLQRGHKFKVGAPFNWTSCGPADQLVDIRSLSFQPSPLVFPGTLTFGFDVQFLDTIQEGAKVAADLKLEVNTRGTWIEIPCIGTIGSCKYDDLCFLMQEHVHCPPDIVNKGIPCACPFTKGEYKLQKYDVDVAAAVFLSGDYRAQVTLTDSVKGQIACYKLAFTVE